jgi:hypothetical protein
MRQGKYLNVILTVNAALVSTLVWMQLVGGGPLSPSANAQNPPLETGIPNAGSQRQRMIEEMQGMRASLDAMRKQLDGGKLKVTIANIDEIKAATRADEKGK